MNNPADDFDSIDDDPQFEELSEDVVDWGDQDLEAAYLKAMSALAASDTELAEPPAARTDQESGDPHVIENAVTVLSSNTDPSLSIQNGPHTSANIEIESHSAASIAELFADSNRAARSSAAANTNDQEPSAETRITARQIIESCLFVGGSALTTKKIAGLLRGQFDVEAIEREIDELNQHYAIEGRPYEIRFGEGGYRLTLRNEFERIRNKVYGLGPKEVRLSQDALEVLAVVAYHQPIKQARVEELGKPGCGAVLRQLVRRELLVVERDPAAPRDVNYRTTARFLSLFGIRSLDELPRHEQVSYK